MYLVFLNSLKHTVHCHTQTYLIKFCMECLYSIISIDRWSFLSFWPKGTPCQYPLCYLHSVIVAGMVSTKQYRSYSPQLIQWIGFLHHYSSSVWLSSSWVWGLTLQLIITYSTWKPRPRKMVRAISSPLQASSNSSLPPTTVSHHNTSFYTFSWLCI